MHESTTGGMDKGLAMRTVAAIDAFKPHTPLSEILIVAAELRDALDQLTAVVLRGLN